MRIRHLLLSGLILMSLLSINVVAQERPRFLTVTTAHWNMDMEDSSEDGWLATEKEYFEKVITKNEYIVSSEVLIHYFTEDNSEVLFVFSYASWEDIEKAGDRNDELAKEAWPDQEEREAFFKKQRAYYSTMHSDEIYSTLPLAKVVAERPSEPLVYYVRINHLAFPEDGKTEEIMGLRTEYFNEVIQKNPYVKGYYPSRHYWGSDSRDMIEAFVTTSLGDIEKALETNWELVQDHWPEESDRKEFFKKMDKYFTGWHGDHIYRNVPELSKH